MWVYLYPSNTETELKNAYIGEYDFVKYQKVEYIETTWTQWIDTSLFPSNNKQLKTNLFFEVQNLVVGLIQLVDTII